MLSNNKRCFFSCIFLPVVVLFGFYFFSFSANAAAATDGVSLSSITTHVNDTVYQLSKIVTDVALIAGICFVLASFFKFHQHKLNPTQVPISQGITLLLIGTALMVFVVILPTAKRAVFGSAAQISKVGGSGMIALIGGSKSS